MASGLLNLGGVLEDKDDYAEAEKLFRRSLAVMEKARGPEHSDVSEVADALGHALMKQGQYDEAIRLYRRASAIDVKTHGDGHAKTGPGIAHLAKCLVEKSEEASGGEQRTLRAEAEALYTKALDILCNNKENGPEHEDTGEVAGRLADLLEELGREEESEAMRTKFADAIAANESSDEEGEDEDEDEEGEGGDGGDESPPDPLVDESDGESDEGYDGKEGAKCACVVS